MSRCLTSLLVGPLAFMGSLSGSGPAEQDSINFDVVSIKPAAPWNRAEMASGKSHLGLRVSPGRVDLRLVSLIQVIALAYEVDRSQIVGPAWLIDPMPFDSLMCDIQAKTPQGALKAQVPEMLRGLLQARFKLSAHRDVTEQSVYALMVGDQGPKLGGSSLAGDAVFAPSDSAIRSDYGSGDNRLRVTGTDHELTEILSGPDLEVRTTRHNVAGGVDHIEAAKMTLPWLSKKLSGLTGRTVVDSTDLKGTFPATFDLPNANSTDSGNIKLISSLLSKIGLKLVQRRLPMGRLVIDHLEKTPTEN